MPEPVPVENGASEEAIPNSAREVEPSVEAPVESLEPKVAPAPAPAPEIASEAVITQSAPVVPPVESVSAKNKVSQQSRYPSHLPRTQIRPQYGSQNSSLFGSIFRKIKSVTGMGSDYSHANRYYPKDANSYSAPHYNKMGSGNIMSQAQQKGQPQQQHQLQHQQQQQQQQAQIQSQKPPLPPQTQPHINSHSQMQINPQQQIQHQKQDELNYMQNVQNNQQQQMMMAALMGSGMFSGSHFFQGQQQQQAQILMMMMMDQQYQQQRNQIQYQQQLQLQQLQLQQQLQQAVAAGQMVPGMLGNPNNNMIMFNDRMVLKNQTVPYRSRHSLPVYRQTSFEGANRSYYRNNYQSDWGNRGYYHSRNRNIYIP